MFFSFYNILIQEGDNVYTLDQAMYIVGMFIHLHLKELKNIKKYFERMSRMRHLFPIEFDEVFDLIPSSDYIIVGVKQLLKLQRRKMMIEQVLIFVVIGIIILFSILTGIICKDDEIEEIEEIDIEDFKVL